MSFRKFYRLASILERYIHPAARNTQWCVKYNYSTDAKALRSKKGKSSLRFARDFVDSRLVRTRAGSGGEGCISFLQLFCNENAGPDGGDGGNGGHVIFETHTDVQGLNHVKTVLEADDGEKGYGKSCHGRNASHTIIRVPVGTVVKNEYGRVVADLNEEGMMFLAARGGAGGKGNSFFASDLDPTPKVAEIGAEGENTVYTLELSSMAHFGLLGFPNAGKSTLLQAVTRANPKVAAYPFTTLKPHLGVVQYDDYEQITIADLPGLIEGSHQNKGLGITFLRHAERCMGLLILLDMSALDPWDNLKILRHEVLCFSQSLCDRPQIIVANKMDVPGSEEALKELKKRLRNEIIVPVSAKHGLNLTQLLSEMRNIYDKQIARRKRQLDKDSTRASYLPLG
ncbi:mitochondrial ribosome-associated GTPase 2 [Planococcus citri]|uniref:mitochondrial ribosome-associated GTPase 2 n=1 Tax=Planococcus citri TaxID=170843 RepID=UPI0031F99534